jgi:hypothetical protein
MRKKYSPGTVSSGYRRLFPEMSVKTGNHWLKACFAEPNLAFNPIYPAFPGANTAFFH